MTNPVTRRSFIKVAGKGLFLISGVGLTACVPERSKKKHDPLNKKPNFLFILADDCTYRDIGCYGGQAYTPNIDRLAKQGMRFTHSFQAASMCSPTRHNIYTGLYPVKSGAHPNHAYAKEGTESIVHYLKPLGYAVALSGKRHISPKEVFPFEYLPGNKNPDMKAVEGFIEDANSEGKPFCLFACSNEPHGPHDKGDPGRYKAEELTLPPYWVDTPETRNGYTKYLAEITYLDGQVGDLLAILKKHGLSDNTIVIFTSEQGDGLPFAKWTCYDSGLQNALVARWPGRIKAGSLSDAMIEYVDVVPTFVTAAGGKPAPVLEGKSYLNVLLGKTNKHKKYVYGLQTTRGIMDGSEHFGIRQIRSRKFKYIVNLTPDVKFQNVIVTKGFVYASWKKKAETDADAADKIARFENRPAEELYDVVKDQYEWNNLADDPKYDKIKKQLREKLYDWMAQQGDKGQATEMEAFEHQTKFLNKKK
ncbi:MAG: sulfatase [Planctomycetes bacterium]|nr:sulfatase [Planctomycetota bacterium]